MPVVVHLEALARSGTTQRHSTIRTLVQQYVRENFTAVRINWQVYPAGDPLAEKVERICVVEVQGGDDSDDIIPLENCRLEVHVYELRSDRDADALSVDDSGTVAATVTDLPCHAFDNLWESLIYDDDIKHRLLHFMSTLMLFSDKNVNNKIISWSRIILLHGPPGTGKTSLCKAMAQKLKIRLSRTFPEGKFIEISAHSLFSKWFSESGKLVGKLFEQIRDLMRDDRVLVCVLIDEVESLTSARNAAASGNEPSDALRVVNAFMTELDRLRTAKNVLILTTSNLMDAMDGAFVDRVDVKQYVGYPSSAAAYEILRSCILELVRCKLVGLVASDLYESTTSSSTTGEFDTDDGSADDDDSDGSAPNPSYARVRRARREITKMEQMKYSSPENNDGASIKALIPAYTQAILTLYSKPDAYSSRIIRLAHECKGFGGRTLRRLAVLAHAKFLHRELSSLDELLDALKLTVAEEQNANVNVLRSQMQQTTISV